MKTVTKLIKKTMMIQNNNSNINQTVIRNNQPQILEFLHLINNNAKDCVGGKKIFISHADWNKFQKFQKMLND